MRREQHKKSFKPQTLLPPSRLHLTGLYTLLPIDLHLNSQKSLGASVSFARSWLRPELINDGVAYLDLSQYMIRGQYLIVK